MGPKVSVVILNWNGKQYIEDCLTSVMAQTYRYVNVIFVDNGSADGSAGFVREKFPEVKVVASGQNLGAAGGFNLGIREALESEDAGFILVANIDARLEPDCISELVRVASLDEKIGSLQPKVLSWSNPGTIDAAGIDFSRKGYATQLGYAEPDTGQYGQIREVFGVCTCIAMFRRAALQDVGLFDEDFFIYHDDTDHTLRLRLAGWKTVLAPSARGYHMHSYSFGKVSPVKIYLLERNQYFYMIKNMPADIVIAHFLRTPVSVLYQCARWAIRRDARSMISCFRGNIDGWLGTPKMLTRRKRIRSASRVTDKQLKGLFFHGRPMAGQKRPIEEE